MLGWICACASNSWEAFFNLLILFLLCRKSHLFTVIKWWANLDWHSRTTQQWKKKFSLQVNKPQGLIRFGRWVFLSLFKNIGSFTMLGRRDCILSPRQANDMPRHLRSQIKTLKPCSVHCKKSPKRPLSRQIFWLENGMVDFGWFRFGKGCVGCVTDPGGSKVLSIFKEDANHLGVKFGERPMDF